MTDDGQPGVDGDTIRVTLTGGAFHGYTNSGVLRGGNIKIH